MSDREVKHAVHVLTRVATRNQSAESGSRTLASCHVAWPRGAEAVPRRSQSPDLRDFWSIGSNIFHPDTGVSSPILYALSDGGLRRAVHASLTEKGTLRASIVDAAAS